MVIELKNLARSFLVYGSPLLVADTKPKSAKKPVYCHNASLSYNKFPPEYNPFTVKTSNNVKETKIAANKFIIIPN